MQSTTHMGRNLLALFISVVALVLALTYSDLNNPQVLSVAALTLFVSLVLLKYDFWYQGLNLKCYKHSWKIATIKLIGLVLTLALVALFYWLLPEYQGSFYTPYYAFLKVLAPWVAVAAVPYFWLVTRYTEQPKDGYYYLPLLLIGQYKRINVEVLKHHALGWLVKAFFLPLMYIYALGKIQYFRTVDLSQVLDNFQAFYHFAIACLYYVDLLFVVVGYMATFKALGTHIRTAESGWLPWLAINRFGRRCPSFISSTETTPIGITG